MSAGIQVSPTAQQLLCAAREIIVFVGKGGGGMDSMLETARRMFTGSTTLG